MTIEAIREVISSKLGERVCIIYEEGRTKKLRCNGIITEVYSNIFIVKDDDYKRSFSYYDILTNSIKMKFKV